ncbi:unnamed protein product [Haemonchus placei]|uniref:Peptidase S41 n=1 Tax=Haemonchus placei TaxID=6290 RepID=A0A0N4WMW4_HAEPC|nr:unnamed protein product [Haemonchus placei]
MLVTVALLIFVTPSSQTAPTIEEFLTKPIPEEAEELTGEALVEYVNKHQPFFKVEYSGVAEQRMRNLMSMEFVEKSGQNHGLLTTADSISNKVTIPERECGVDELAYTLGKCAYAQESGVGVIEPLAAT